MKKIPNLLSAIAVLFVVCSCTSNFNNPEIEGSRASKVRDLPSLEKPDVINYKGVPTLRFKDKESLKRWFKYLGVLSSVQQEQTVKNLGVTPLYSRYIEVYNKISDGLTQKGELFLINGEFNSLKKAYADVALFEDNPENPYPESRMKSLSESNTANLNGVYLLGDSVCSVDTYDSYKELSSANSNVSIFYEVPETGLRVNAAHARTSNRKATLTVSIDPSNYTVYLRFAGQRKDGWIITWWTRYATMFGARITLTERSHSLRITSLGDSYTSITMMQDKARINEAPWLTLVDSGTKPITFQLGTREFDKAVNLPFCTFIKDKDEDDEEIYTPPYILRGKMKIWSRGIGFMHAGEDNLDIRLGS